MNKYKTKREMKRKRAISIFEIALMIVASFAFAFLLSDNRVRALIKDSNTAGNTARTDIAWSTEKINKIKVSSFIGESQDGYRFFYGTDPNGRTGVYRIKQRVGNAAVSFAPDPQGRMNAVNLQSYVNDGSFHNIEIDGVNTFSPDPTLTTRDLDSYGGQQALSAQFAAAMPKPLPPPVRGYSVTDAVRDGWTDNKDGTVTEPYTGNIYGVADGKVNYADLKSNKVAAAVNVPSAGPSANALPNGAQLAYPFKIGSNERLKQFDLYTDSVNKITVRDGTYNYVNGAEIVTSSSTGLTYTKNPRTGYWDVAQPRPTGGVGGAGGGWPSGLVKSPDGQYAIETSTGNKYKLNADGSPDWTTTGYVGNTYIGKSVADLFKDDGGRTLGNNLYTAMASKNSAGISSAVTAINKNAPALKAAGIQKVWNNGDGTITVGMADGGYKVIGKEGTITSNAPTTTKIGGMTFTGWSANLIQGLEFSFWVATGIQTIGRLLGLKDNMVNSLSVAAIGGIMAYNGIKAMASKAIISPQSVLSKFAPVIGLGVAVGIFLLMYKTTKTKTVYFTCMPYEPPLGGKKCEECNKDLFRPCSEYRCKSLGQACQLLNKEDPAKAICAWVGRNDVKSPEIAPLNKSLTSGLKYVPGNAVRPAFRGVKIASSAPDGCLQAFTPLKFGLNTSEPAQCKVDYNHTGKFDEMQFYLGGTNIYSYEHEQQMILPNSGNDTIGGPIINNDGSASLYVRCRDANGNENVDEYAVKFCVKKGPDTTPPIVAGTSITDGSPVQFNVDKVPIDVYVNEPSECKWSRIDKDYKDMENNMTCATDPGEINSQMTYTCSGNLTGVKNMESNKFYFKCLDQPSMPEADRMVMTQSYPLTIRGSQPLIIDSISPNGTISGSTSVVNVTLQVQTSAGADEGKALCYISPVGAADSYVAMADSNNYVSKQELYLEPGNYSYYFRCLDSGGNSAENNTRFTIYVDKQAPSVTRVYRESDDVLQIVTDENAECSYSLTTCSFSFNDGLKDIVYPNTNQNNVMWLKWVTDETYYIKCKDSSGNEPNPDQCSVVAKGTKLDTSR